MSSDFSAFNTRWVIIGVLLLGTLQSAVSQSKNVRKHAEQFMESGRFDQAAEMLSEYCLARPRDFEAWYWLAKSQFETNDLLGARESLDHLETENKREDSDVTLLIAQVLHQDQQFENAIKYYKRYLALEEKTNRYEEIAAEIKRCATGLRYNYLSDAVLIENMGMEVNSKYDDFAPVESHNFESRVYFSSIRALRIQDRFDDSGAFQQSVQGLDCDMFSTEIVNGAWSKAEALNPRLNTPNQEVLQDFGDDGMVLVFSRGSTIDQSDLWVDTFDLGDQQELGSLWTDSPIKKNEGIRGLYFFSDSTVLFASNQRGGYGGYDLFMVLKRAGEWSEAFNLGEDINSEFDEVTPFLCKDGRTLYFSSNRLNSMGGFDIFRSTFTDRDVRWAEPVNLGRPLNSAGNDLFYRISSAGLMSYFSSDRKTGMGGQDIYSAYFKRPQSENLKTSTPPLFTEVRDFKLFSESMASGGNNTTETQEVVSTYEVPYLLYRDDQILTAQNKPKLEKIVAFLKTYPHIKLEIICHSDQTSVSNFDLYFALKRGEQIADYLVQKGIKENTIYLKGLGGNHPLALNELQGKDNETGRFFNRRVDFRMHEYDQIPLKLKYELPVVQGPMKDARLDQYYDAIAGLSYRVEFAELDQLYKGDLIGKYPNTLIEKVPNKQTFSYCSGIFNSFDGALKHLSDIKSEGFLDAKVVGYLDGIRVENDRITEQLLSTYPDLKNYILYLD